MRRSPCSARTLLLSLLLILNFATGATVSAVDNSCPLGSELYPTNNPPVAACGLPVEGCIVASVTYTLTADCTQTGPLYVNIDGISVTVEGGGHTIDARALTGDFNALWTGDPSRTLTLRNATVVGGGVRSGAAIVVHGPATLENVSLREADEVAFSAYSLDGATPASNLTNVLIERVFGNYYLDGRAAPTAIEVEGGASVTANNLVIRSNFLGNTAIGAATGSSVTLTGCFTGKHNFPQTFFGGVTDNSSGPCSGTIGNGDSAARVYSPPQPAACGLPSEGVLEQSATYSLVADCQQTGTLFIPKHVALTIEGNGYTIRGASLESTFLDNTETGKDARLFFGIAGPTTIRNTVLAHGTSYVLRTWLQQSHLIENTVFRNNDSTMTIYDSDMMFDRVLFENNVLTGGSTALVFPVFSSTITIRDSIFRNNSGLDTVIHGGFPATESANPRVRILGCVTFEGNSTLDMVDIDDPGSHVTDTNSGPCPETEISQGLHKISLSATQGSQGRHGGGTHCLPGQVGCGHAIGVQDLRVGSVARVFRENRGGDTIVGIYEISQDTSQGFLQLALTQSQIAPLVGEHIVGVSADGRVLAVVYPDKNVTIKVGPDHEGKILHLTLEGGLHGRVLDMITTYGPPPGLFLRAETSLGSCAVTTIDILNFRATPGGAVIGLVPAHVTLTVKNQTLGWFQVDNHGVLGWISADFVTTQGDCG